MGRNGKAGASPAIRQPVTHTATFIAGDIVQLGKGRREWIVVRLVRQADNSVWAYIQPRSSGGKARWAPVHRLRLWASRN